MVVSQISIVKYRVFDLISAGVNDYLLFEIELNTLIKSPNIPYSSHYSKELVNSLAILF